LANAAAVAAFEAYRQTGELDRREDSPHFRGIALSKPY
jgi:hypothetical protein